MPQIAWQAPTEDARKLKLYLERIREVYPELSAQRARLLTTYGQFNDVVVVDDALIFRFPRTPQVAATMVREVAILQRIGSYLSLAVPNPIYNDLQPPAGQPMFMGYGMLPGEALWNETVEALHNEAAVQRLAEQIGVFLRELHAIPINQLGLDLPMIDGPDTWATMYEEFREHLFPHMRLDAREQMTAHFQKYLNDPQQFDFQPVLRHGDFGTGNILYDPAKQRITGVIDWSSVGLGDPAVDLGSIMGLGEAFVHRMYAVYPELEAMAHRTTFFRGTYALQQALYALRDGDQASFEDGIADYI